jgi:hypothetical protein
MDEIIYEEEETKEEEPLKNGFANGKANGAADGAATAGVDADLFQQEAVDGEEEEPDFD